MVAKYLFIEKTHSVSKSRESSTIYFQLSLNLYYNKKRYAYFYLNYTYGNSSLESCQLKTLYYFYFYQHIWSELEYILILISRIFKLKYKWISITKKSSKMFQQSSKK